MKGNGQWDPTWISFGTSVIAHQWFGTGSEWCRGQILLRLVKTKVDSEGGFL